MKRVYVYDLEVYPNIFTHCGKFTDSDEIFMFEMSDRINERTELLTHLSYLRNLGIEMVGFNNIGFDYFLLHELMTNPYTFDYIKAFQICQTIINSQRNSNGRSYKYIKPSERLIPQVDIYKVCHFDNRSKTTNLKALQFAMRLESIEDLPFDIRPLNNQEKDELKEYNIHDVTSTETFYLKNAEAMQMRRDYLENGTLRGDVLNYADTKIGIEYLVNRLGRGKCFVGSKPRQTFRESVSFSSIILPKISFRTEPFQETLSWFMSQTKYTTLKESPKLKKNLAGLDFHFGIGGVHASADNKKYESNETHQIIDVDVKSMYPSVAIANRFAPEHLGDSFVEVYKQIVVDRSRYPKGSPQNAALKLASNGAYGNSNNPYSFMYDPKFTFAITINGQLQLLQLVEMIDLIPDCELIQGNTDGVTVYINKEYINLFRMWCQVWEEMTGLILEEVPYNRMWIRDVNSYISETMDGKLKRKGAYWYPLCEADYSGWWNKDFSNLASKMAVEKVLTDSWPVETAIRLVTNPFDFMLRYKATGASQLFIGDVKQLKTVRYYVSLSGQPMTKITPVKPEKEGRYKRKNSLKDKFFDDVMAEIGENVWDERIHTKGQKKYETAITGVQKGWKVKQCNVASDFDWSDVDWKYYIDESKKLIIGAK